MFLDDKNIEVS